jgi:PAS domain S-box-containing protein
MSKRQFNLLSGYLWAFNFCERGFAILYLYEANLEPVFARLGSAEADSCPFFSLSRDLMCVASLDGCFKRVNPAWESCLGWRGDELLGTPFLDLVHPGDRAATATELGRLAEGAATIAFENRYRGKDGADRWLQWNAICRPERQLIYGTAHDVTGRKRLEREIIEAGDREKERIGRDLHDGLCQNFAGIAALGAALARRLAARADPAAAAAAEIAGLLNQAIGDARDLARGLDPAGLAQLGLAAVLDALAANIQVLHRVTCRFVHDRHFPRLETAVEAAKAACASRTTASEFLRPPSGRKALGCIRWTAGRA